MSFSCCTKNPEFCFALLYSRNSKGEPVWAEPIIAAKRVFSKKLKSRTYALRKLRKPSAVSNRGTMRFMLYHETMTAQVLIRFMQRLIKDAGRKVFFVLDNLRVHHSKAVQAWLENHRDQIKVF